MPSSARPAPRRPRARPLVIAHRGASGYLPEHTLAAYAVAALQGADFIEPDLVVTRDGHLIARHDNRLDLTTDVAAHAEFAARRTCRQVDGAESEGWFSEDFTLAELRRLRARERLPDLRPGSARFDGRFGIPTFEEVLVLARALERFLGRPVGICPEIKHPSYFAARGLPLEAPLLAALRAHGYEAQPERVYIQSFEIASLERLRQRTRLPLLQLLLPEDRPGDVVRAGGTLTYREMTTPAGLARIARYADAIGPDKNQIVAPDAAGRVMPERASDLIAQAHAHGLEVLPYTFRAENAFLPACFRSSDTPDETGDLAAELACFLALGVDGFFIDQPDVGARLRDRAPAGPR
jgi:glycerophosphoryl diester phosphodiesterase